MTIVKFRELFTCRSASDLKAVCYRAMKLVIALMWFANAVLAEESSTIPTRTLLMVDGKPLAGRLQSVDERWNISFIGQGTIRSLTAEEVIRWGHPIEPQRGSLILLADGGALVGDILALDDEHLTFTSEFWGGVRFPAELVQGIVLRAPARSLDRQRLTTKVRTYTQRQDRLLLDDDSYVTGTLLAMKDDKFHVQTESDVLEIAYEKVAAVSFNKALVRSPPAQGRRVLVGFEDGSTLAVTRLVLDREAARIDLPGGVFMRSNTGLATSDVITYLQPLDGRVIYLSDVEPTAARAVPFLNLSRPHRNDLSVVGGRLTSGGNMYGKGLGVMSYSLLAYTLSEEYLRFEAELAIDDQAGKRGSVEFRIYVDRGNGKWQAAYTSPVVRGGASPHSVSVDLTNVERISLIADYADRGDELDYANWLDARLIK